MDHPKDNDATASAADYDSVHLGNVAAAMRELKHPKQIGPYHIQEVIGQGGMGTVYKAEQIEPIHRTVALKVIKVGMDTEEVIRRFESERQAVALMSHMNVTRVLDAGGTESGRPYFVMEYVAGQPITVFADANRLTVRQRLELFVQACDALEHAHQKGIIHRDLKPSNILVTRESPTGPPLVKVIDFGLAKAIGVRLTDKTMVTESGQLLGTPAYMSPEQAGMNSADIDTRTDVYSLGMVLYELLTGSLPFDTSAFQSGGYGQIQRMICEVDPPRLSTRLSQLGARGVEIARSRQLPLAALERQLKGDVGWIPLKALRKQRAERYATATELAEDVRNYLANRPLRAGPISIAYRIGKLVRRNKVPVAAGGIVTVALLAGVAGTAWQAIRATRAQNHLAIALSDVRQQKTQADLANADLQASQKNLSAALVEVRRQKQQAEDSVASLRAVNTFLTDDLLHTADPDVARGEKLTVREALDSAAKTIDGKFNDQPLVEASIRFTLALTYDALGRADLGLPHAQRALEIRRKLLGNDDAQSLAAINCVVTLLESQADWDKGQVLCQEAIERAKSHAKDEPRLFLAALSNMGHLLHAQGKLDEAEPFYRQAMDESRRVLGAEDPETLTAINNVACLLQSQQRNADAEPLFRELVAAKRRQLGDDHPDTVIGIANLAFALQGMGNLKEAETMHREASKRMRHVLGDEHPATLREILNYGSLDQDLGRLTEAETLYRQSLAGCVKVLGDDHPFTLNARNHLASVLGAQGKFEEALKLNVQVLDYCRRKLGNDHPDTILMMNNVGVSFWKAGHMDEAEPLFAEAYRRAPASQLDERTIAQCMARWGPSLAALGRWKEAEPPLIEAHRRLLASNFQDSELMHNVLTALIALTDQANRPEEAGNWRAELKRTFPTSQPTKSGRMTPRRTHRRRIQSD